MNTEMVLPIKGTFDIALARNVLRSKIATRRWSPTFNARANAALTALGELVLLSDKARLTVIKMSILDQGVENGIELFCNIQLSSDNTDHLEAAQLQLERVSDDLEIEETLRGTLITARIWVNQGAVA